MLKQAIFEDDSNENVFGIGDELKLKLLLLDYKVKALDSFEILRSQILENLFDGLCFDLAFHFHFLLSLFLHNNILCPA